MISYECRYRHLSAFGCLVDRAVSLKTPSTFVYDICLSYYKDDLGSRN